MEDKPRIKVIVKKRPPQVKEEPELPLGELRTTNKLRRANNKKKPCCYKACNSIRSGVPDARRYQQYVCKVCNCRLHMSYEPTEEEIKQTIIDDYNKDVNDCEIKVERLAWLRKCCLQHGMECQYPTKDSGIHVKDRRNGITGPCVTCGQYEPLNSAVFWW